MARARRTRLSVVSDTRSKFDGRGTIGRRSIEYIAINSGTDLSYQAAMHPVFLERLAVPSLKQPRNEDLGSKKASWSIHSRREDTKKGSRATNISACAYSFMPHRKYVCTYRKQETLVPWFGDSKPFHLYLKRTRNKPKCERTRERRDTNGCESCLF